IFQTCKTYLIQQGRFLLMLFVLIAVAITYYLVGFGHATEYELTDRTMQELRLELRGDKRELPPHTEAVLKKLEPVVVRRTEPSAKGEHAKSEKAPTKTEYQFTDKAKFISMLKSRLTDEEWDQYGDTITRVAAPEPIGAIPKVFLVLLFSVVGMGGSYWVAWYGIRVNTYANCRTAFASLKGEPWDVVNIPLRAGMSIGLFLISLELVMMVIILLFVPRQIVGVCFLGFAIGESLGASALRIAGGIFTKIADIGSDLMKIVFQVKEDD